MRENVVIEKTMLLKIEEITGYAYDVTKMRNEKDMYLVTDESIIGMIEDLIVEIDDCKEKYKKLEEDVRDNYKPIPMQELI